MGIPEHDDRKRLSAGVRGRVAFHPDATFEELWRHHHEGWRFQKTRFTNSFTYEDYCATVPAERIPSLLLGPHQDVTLHASQQPLQPRQGDLLVIYAPYRSGQEARIETRCETAKPAH